MGSGQQRSARFLKPLEQAVCGWPAGVRGPTEGTETEGSHSAKPLSQQTTWKPLLKGPGAPKELCPCLPGSSLEAAIWGILKLPSPEVISLSRLPLPRRSPGICLCPVIE